MQPFLGRGRRSSSGGGSLRGGSRSSRYGYRRSHAYRSGHDWRYRGLHHVHFLPTLDSHFDVAAFKFKLGHVLLNQEFDQFFDFF